MKNHVILGHTQFFLMIALWVFLPSSLKAANCSYSNDPDLAQKKEICQKSPSKEWLCELNRCLNKKEAVSARQDYLNCDGLANDQTRAKCHQDLANKHTGVSHGEGQGKLKGGAPQAVLAGAYGTLLFLAKKGATSGGTCLSRKIFMGTSAVHVLAHLYTTSQTKKQLKNLSGKYQDEAVGMDSHAAQQKAFLYLKDEQSTVAKVAKQRKLTYMLLMAGYAASLTTAALEMMPMVTFLTPCTADTEVEPETEGIADSASPTGTGIEGAASTKEKLTSMGITLSNSPAIAIASGVALGLTGQLRSAAASQEKESKSNINQIDEVMASFEESIAGLCPDGRNNYNNPRCYCYNDNGQKNNNRTNSGICHKLWAQDDHKYIANASDYSNTKNGPRTGCLTLNQQFDADCKCRKVKDKKTGQNACYKAPYNTNVNLGGAANLAKTGAMMNLATEGISGLEKLGQAQIAGLADQHNKAARVLWNKVNEKRKSKGLKPIIFNREMLKGFIKKAQKSKGFKSVAGPALPQLAKNSRPTNGALKKALEKITKKTGIGQSLSASGGKGLTVKSSNKSDFQFDFGGNNNSAQKGRVQNFMDKKYQYKDNDIVKKNGSSIWNIISKRYLQSGLKRLFEDQ